MNITPLNDRLLIKRQSEETTTTGGIVIPDSAKEKTFRGEVVSVGTGKVMDSGETRKLLVKKGDKVLFEKYAGTEVKVEGEEHLIIREDEVLGIIN